MQQIQSAGKTSDSHILALRSSHQKQVQFLKRKTAKPRLNCKTPYYSCCSALFSFYRMYATKCTGCKATIPANEFVMRALGNVYHLQCFVCAMCGQRLVKGQEFALKDNKLYCKEDYGKLPTKGSSNSPPQKQQQESK